MTPEQARRLTTLKSAKAARISRESAAAKRRLVTVGVSLAVVVAVVGLAAFAVLPWWVVAVPSVFLVGTLIASRQAGIRTERAQSREEAQLRELEDEIRGGVARSTAPTGPEAAQKEPEARPRGSLAIGRSLGSAAGQRKRDSGRAGQGASEEKAFESEASRRVTEETADAPEPAVANKAAEPVSQPLAPIVRDNTWVVADFPAPTYTKKAPVTGRQVHADTDIKGVPQVETAPGRPVATSAQAETIDSETAAQSAVKFDLDAILDARRAQ